MLMVGQGGPLVSAHNSGTQNTKEAAKIPTTVFSCRLNHETFQTLQCWEKLLIQTPDTPCVVCFTNINQPNRPLLQVNLPAPWSVWVCWVQISENYDCVDL